jgi:hypothetical protein
MSKNKFDGKFFLELFLDGTIFFDVEDPVHLTMTTLI